MLEDFIDNTITRAVADVEGRIAGLDADAVARVEESATLDAAEWVALGDLSTRAMLADLVTQGEAQTLHAIHTGFLTEGATLAQRVVFLQFAVEALPLCRL